MGLRKVILLKLFRKRIIGGKHTSVETALHGIPKHLIGEAKYQLQGLMKEGIIISKPAFYGLQISLNPEKLKEIIKIIKE